MFGFQRFGRFSVYWNLSFKYYGSYRSAGIEISSQLNNHTEYLKTEQNETICLATFVEYWSTQLNHQTKAWLKVWSFQFVMLSVCMQLHTQHLTLSSKSLRFIYWNVCFCVHMSVCFCMSQPKVEQKKYILTNAEKCYIQFLVVSSTIVTDSGTNTFFLSFKCFGTFKTFLFMSSYCRPPHKLILSLIVQYPKIAFLAYLTQKNKTSPLQVIYYYFFRWNLVAMANNAAKGWWAIFWWQS